MKTTIAFFKLLGLVLFVTVLNFSCKKDGNVDNILPVDPAATGPFTVTLPNNPVTATVAGRVLDENDNPVTGEPVTGGGITVLTGNDGTFRINNGNFNGAYATVRITRSNYFPLVRTLSPTSGNTQYVVLKLSRKTAVGTIGINGGSLQFGSGNITIQFPANAFADNSGNAITSDVSVFATYIDPTQADASYRMPGNMSGVDAPSTPYLLKSFGMMGIELKDASGETVKLAPGKKASITANIPSALTATAPATMPLWYFDEANGVWVKEGDVTKTGNSYKGDVSHFTFWNMDMYTSFCWFKARFLNRNDSTALPYARLAFNGVGEPHVYYPFTDGGGYTNGMIPLSTNLQMRFFKADGTVLLDTIIGPYTNAVNDIGNVYIDVPPLPVVVKGSLLNCNGQSVSNGSATVLVGGVLDYHTDITDGEFSIPLPVTPAINAQLLISTVDSSNNYHPPVRAYNYNGTNNIINAGFFTACAIDLPPQFISYRLDGSDHIFARGLDSAFCNRTFAFNRTNIACRRANGSPTVEGYVAFITGPTNVGGTDTSSILTLEQFSSASTPQSLNIVSFNENYYEYPAAQGVEGWVTGHFTCVYTDAANMPHTIKSNFRMWRRN